MGTIDKRNFVVGYVSVFLCSHYFPDYALNISPGVRCSLCTMTFALLLQRIEWHSSAAHRELCYLKGKSEVSPTVPSSLFVPLGLKLFSSIRTSRNNLFSLLPRNVFMYIYKLRVFASALCH